MNSSVIIFPGSNCDRDMDVALKKFGFKNKMVWHDDDKLPKSDLIVLPGGFSYGDYLRCGSIAGKSKIIQSVIDFANSGGLVLGICNGFQILTETGMVPGALIRNAGLKFACRNVGLQVCETLASPFTSGLVVNKRLRIPIAHNEGNYFAGPDELNQLEDDGQIAFRYTDSETFGPANPNGAARDIAGVISSNGRVLGMMPHPERAMSNLHGGTDGAYFLLKSLEALIS